MKETKDAKYDATQQFVEYGIKFTEKEAEALNDFFYHHQDIQSNNFSYRTFGDINAFNNVITEHTIVEASRLRPPKVELIVVEFALRPYKYEHWTDVKFKIPSIKDISKTFIPNPDENASAEPNVVIMSITKIDGVNISKRYEACVFNPDADYVAEGIRWVNAV